MPDARSVARPSADEILDTTPPVIGGRCSRRRLPSSCKALAAPFIPQLTKSPFAALAPQPAARPGKGREGLLARGRGGSIDRNQRSDGPAVPSDDGRSPAFGSREEIRKLIACFLRGSA